ncbi:aminotransferase class I/II-fold pyridoxal phosphate-dependent enzyme [Corynebacterium provencense]|uniref:aminotransferase class I/II-fold pyridoxal phosphate-dependent enzyme n=1 Tax=Corynebacterium provencense TaxID=1737425 RepID=UPI0021C34FEC|nr:aminotransferase class I/II-fold pyridoxal phosphate-dependent enzyme [Corynebacterium provencense]
MSASPSRSTPQSALGPVPETGERAATGAGDLPLPISGSTAAGIVESIRDLVDRGVLTGGDRLPPVRGLADTLGVNRNTVQSAYRQLVTAGVAVSRRGAGTTVAGVPGTVTEGAARGPGIGSPGTLVDIGHGNPDATFLPDPATVRLSPAPPPLYGTSATHPELGRVALRLLGPDLADRAEDAVISVTAGAVDAIERLLATVTVTGDAVALEDPCFLSSGTTTRLAGYRVFPVPVDGEGMQVQPLRDALAAGARAVVCTPRAHNPTGVSLTPGRASALREVLKEHPGVLVVEDDQFAGLSRSRYETVIPAGHPRWALVRSMSKSLGPDLRTALVASDPETAERLSRRINGGTTWVSHLLQRTVAAMLSDGAVRSQLSRASAHYASRNRVFLGKSAEAGLSSPSVDGLNIWVDLGVPSTAATRELRSAGWIVRDGALFRARPAVGQGWPVPAVAGRRRPVCG